VLAACVTAAVLAPSTVAASTDVPSKSLHGVPGVVRSIVLTVRVRTLRNALLSALVLAELSE
jgi:hypothetical protein